MLQYQHLDVSIILIVPFFLFSILGCHESPISCQENDISDRIVGGSHNYLLNSLRCNEEVWIDGNPIRQIFNFVIIEEVKGKLEYLYSNGNHEFKTVNVNEIPTPTVGPRFFVAGEGVPMISIKQLYLKEYGLVLNVCGPKMVQEHSLFTKPRNESIKWAVSQCGREYYVGGKFTKYSDGVVPDEYIYNNMISCLVIEINDKYGLTVYWNRDILIHNEKDAFIAFLKRILLPARNKRDMRLFALPFVIKCNERLKYSHVAEFLKILPGEVLCQIDVLYFWIE